MFQKGSFSVPSDTSGVFLTKVIDIKKSNNTKLAKVGKFMRVVIKTCKTSLIKKRKKKTRSICIRSKHFYIRNDGFTFQFVDNALVLLKRRMNTWGRELLGPTSKELHIKKFTIAFKRIF